jgi:hypothetical protein
MKGKIFLSVLLILFCVLNYAQVGINTDSPSSSAILEVSADSPPGSSTNTKKGFLPPKVSLKNTLDNLTIPDPAKGLFVYNTADAGVFPNEVSKDNYYFWNGNSWVKLMNTQEVLKAVKPRVFYVEGNDFQYFDEEDMNSFNTTPPVNLVTFSNPIINTDNIVSLDNTTSIFTINLTGMYEISAFVNYNPMAKAIIGTNHNKRAFLNVKIQKLTNGSWVDIIGSRTAWGIDGSELKTAIIMGTPVTFSQGDQIRLTISNPFMTEGAYNDHCGSGECFIGTDLTNNIPVSKGLKMRLLDYNLK